MMNSSLSRAGLFSSLALLILLAAQAYAANPIQVENAKPGTTAWQLTNEATAGEIEGYASLTGVNRGGQISFFINTPESSYAIAIYRMGWYGGAGGRLVATVPAQTGTSQPLPTPDPVTGMIECRWTKPYTLTVPNNVSDPTDWASGIYLAKLTAGTSGKQKYIMFVVRDDARRSDYLFLSSVNTYEAYNTWGGKSLYDYNSVNGAARKVSFNRPYSYIDSTAEFLPGCCGWEYNMLRWLEREGYDVTYVTDVDLHSNSNLLPSHKAFLVVGHPEYWTWEMRGNVETARGLGVNLGFFSANTSYWQIRYEPSPVTGAPARTIVGYKASALTADPYATDSDPSNDYLITVRWRDPPVNRPEEAFVGVMYEYDPVNGDIVVDNSSNWVYSGTLLRNGDHLTGLLGYEVDRIFGYGPAGTIRLAHSPYPLGTGTSYSDMTVYTVGNATVFATGSMQWTWGLDDYNAPQRRSSRLNPAAQQVTRNVLARFVGDKFPVAKAGGPYSGSSSSIIQFNGSGSFDPDGTIAKYQWIFGDGATGTGPQPTYTYATGGTYTVILIVTDDKGAANSNSTTATISDTVPTAPTALKADPLGKGKVMLSWNDNSNNESFFRIERSSSPATGFAPVATLAANAISYQDRNVVSLQTYYYRMYAVNSLGDSLPSNTASVTVR